MPTTSAPMVRRIANLGGRFVAGSQHGGVDAFGHGNAQFRGHALGDVAITRANRLPTYPGSAAPANRRWGRPAGFDPCRLMWSEISTSPPRSSERLMPPAALVNTMERTPMRPQHAHAVRHLRRRIAFVEMRAAGHHRHVAARPACRRSACRRGRPPWRRASPESRQYGISTRSVSSSANAPRPLPSTTPMAGRSAVRLSIRVWLRRSQQHSRDAGRHEIGHGARGHRAQSQARQIRLAARRQRADAADLNGDRAEIGETAQRVSGDDERARIERWPSSGPASETPRIR